LPLAGDSRILAGAEGRGQTPRRETGPLALPLSSNQTQLHHPPALGRLHAPPPTSTTVFAARQPRAATTVLPPARPEGGAGGSLELKEEAKRLAEKQVLLLLLYSRYRSSRRSLSLKLSDTRVYEPQIRGTTARLKQVISTQQPMVSFSLRILVYLLVY